jgi:hypothetical protein
MVYPVDPQKCLQGAWPVAAQLQKAPASALTALAGRIIAAAGAYDLSRVEKVDAAAFFAKEGVKPNVTAPPYVFTADGRPGADSTARPLDAGEQWNAAGTRRGTLCGVYYRTDREGFPVNPYTKIGIRGPGKLWHFGPNIAVDNGILLFRPDEKGVMTAYVRGIIRGDNNKPAMAGGFAKTVQDVTGAHSFDAAADRLTRCEEFFEEMVSGSVTLLPAYAQRLDKTLKGHEAGEQEVALKMEQVKTLDPGFWQRLEEIVGKARICYQGPVICGSRNTDTSWIETSVGWYVLDEAAWNHIKGADANNFGYEISAGDDAAGIICQKLDGKLLNDATDSHGALMAYMAASWLLDAQERNVAPDPAILRQFEELAAHMEKEAAPAPSPNLPPRPQG